MTNNPPRRRGRPHKEAPLRDNLYRPAIESDYKALVAIVADNRGWSAQDVVQEALLKLATDEELNQWSK